MSQLLPPRFLFRFAVPIQQVSGIPTDPPGTGQPRMLNLPEACRLPDFSGLDAAPDGSPNESAAEPLDLRVAWNPQGLAVSLEVTGRKKRLENIAANPAFAEGLHLWLDTRNTQNVHRATRFCHHFCLLPRGTSGQPQVVQFAIPRAKEDAPMAKPQEILVQASVRSDGYWLECWLPASALSGFDPEANPRLGFFYRVRDTDLGDRLFAAGAEFPFATDPSLWGTLELR